MNNIFLLATIISIVFLIAKFIEMRFIDKESKPLKFLIRDTLVVYFSVICGYYVLEQVKPMMQSAESQHIVTPVFTDNPEF